MLKEFQDMASGWCFPGGQLNKITAHQNGAEIKLEGSRSQQADWQVLNTKQEHTFLQRPAQCCNRKSLESSGVATWLLSPLQLAAEEHSWLSQEGCCAG